MTIPDLGSDLLSVVLRTAIVYVCLVLGFRFLGKREAGQLSTLDLVVLLVIANAVQNAMVGENTSIWGGITAVAVLLLADKSLGALKRRVPKLRTALEGEPTLLIRDGRVLREAMEREGIEVDELRQALREHGIADLEEVRLAVLETDGTISVVPRTGDEWRSDSKLKRRRPRSMTDRLG